MVKEEDMLFRNRSDQQNNSLLANRFPNSDVGQGDAPERTTVGEFEVPANEQGEPVFGEQTFIGAREGPDGMPVITPSATKGRGQTTATLIDIHENQRSEREQEADERYNAPIADTPEQWARHPDQYDWPGVDTIPESRRFARAQQATEKAKEEGFVREVEEMNTDESTVRGGFAGAGKIEYNPNNNDYGRTLAHELGHTLDRELDGEEQEQARFSQELAYERGFFDELTEASEEARSGMREEAYDPSGAEEVYRGKAPEKFADFVSVAITAPQRAKSEFPDLLNEVRSETDFLDDVADFSEPETDIR